MKQKRETIGRIAGTVIMAVFLSGLMACGRAQETGQNEEVLTPVATELPQVTGSGLSSQALKSIQGLQQGKALNGLQAVGEDSPYYCNLESNMLRGGHYKDYPVLLCKDPVYDITYYVNYGRNYFIYALRNGVFEPAVEFPARELYCKAGELYFLVDSYDLYEFDGVEQGNILKYNPVDGSIELLIAEPDVVDMVVYQDGIYYQTEKELSKDEDGNRTIKSHCYCFSFTEKKSSELDFTMSLECWRGNRFVTVYNEVFQGVDSYQDVYLENRDGERVITLGDTLPYRFQIQGEYMYYIDQSSSFVRRHLETGETTLLAELAFSYGKNFIIHNDVVYFGNHLRLSLTDGKQYYVSIKDRAMGPGSSLDGFFTDGENLYCVNSERLWRMTDSKIAENGLKRGDIPGREAEFNCYEYQLYPFGEE